MDSTSSVSAMLEESCLLLQMWMRSGINSAYQVILCHVQFAQSHFSRTHCVDYRTRRDRTEWCTVAFDAQMQYLTDAFLEWSLTSAEGNSMPARPIPANSGHYPICVVNTLGGYKPLFVLIPDLSSAYKETKLVILPTDKMVASSIIHNGCIPSSPLTPSACITIQCLELYRIAHLQCPHLSIQAFIKTLCDLHSVS